MDSYLMRLATPKRPSRNQQQQEQRSADTARLQQKLQLYEKKFKEMQLNSHIEVGMS